MRPLFYVIMGISQPFKPIILFAVGGLLLVLTVLLLLTSLDMNESPVVTVPSTRLIEASSVAKIPPGDDVDSGKALARTPEASTPPPAATAPPVPESIDNGWHRPEETATAHLVETIPSDPGFDDEKFTPSPTASDEGQGVIPEPDDWRRVEVSELEISFDAPDDWYRQGEEWAWSPLKMPVPRIGFVWGERKRPVAMLPGALTVLHQENLDLGWTVASSFRLERRQGDELVVTEWHVVAQIGDEFTGDFYASGRSLEELASIEPVLSHMLTTVAFRTAPDGPVETSIGFLRAVMRDPAGNETRLFLSDSLQGESALLLLNIDQVYSSFVVTLLPAVDGRITVQATLNFSEGQVAQRMLLLVKQDEGWRIDEINSDS